MKTAADPGGRYYPATDRGATTGNLILQALPPAILAKITPYMERTELRRDDVLVRSQDHVSRVYFIEQGLTLFTKMMSDGRSTMTASVGREGMTIPNMAERGNRSGAECFVLIPGSALSIDRSLLLNLAAKFPHLAIQLQHYGLFMSEQITQISACNRLHSLEQRCARFLLTAHRSVEGRPFTLTQEMLAMTLGAQRPHVSVVATQFRKKNLIEYRRGQMRVSNAERLRLASCECHDMLTEALDAMFKPIQNSMRDSSQHSCLSCASTPLRTP